MDTLGPGPHNPMFGMFADEIILEGSGGPCILGLLPQDAAAAILGYKLQREKQNAEMGRIEKDSG